jgi:hypothetical protein
MLEDDWLSCPPKLFADGAIPEVVTGMTMHQLTRIRQYRIIGSACF